MPSATQEADPGPSDTQEEFQEYTVKRDRERPLSFAGVQLAKATRQPAGLSASTAVMSGVVETIEAAVYKTRGGKFITSLKRTRESLYVSAVQRALAGLSDDDDAEVDNVGKTGYHKAGVHDTLEAAMDWFRPGKLTDEIRQQLGLDEPLRIE